MNKKEIIFLTRTGDCNMCGGCCGLDAESPWAEGLLDRNLNNRYERFLERFPYAPLLGVAAGDSGFTELERSRGISVVGSGEFPYVWADGRPCQDTTPDEDEATPTSRCPFLLDAEDDTHPCGLVDTDYEEAWVKTCSGREQSHRGVPPRNYQKEFVKQWKVDYPNCSYDWE